MGLRSNDCAVRKKPADGSLLIRGKFAMLKADDCFQVLKTTYLRCPDSLSLNMYLMLGL